MDTTYALTCSNSAGSITRSTTVGVNNNNNNPQTPPTLTLNADQSSVNSGNSTSITWNSGNATTCNATGGANGWSGSKNNSGSTSTGALYSDTTFTMVCANTAGATTRSITVGVNNNNNNVNSPTVDIRADDTSIDEDDSTYIRWNSNNATSCTANNGTNGWSGSRATSGSFFTGDLNDDETFSITCRNSNGISATDSVTVRVDNNNNNNGNLDLELEADDDRLDYGESTTIRWDSDDADDCDASGGRNNWSGRRNTSGTFRTGALYQDTTYRMTCENDDDDITESITIRVADNNNNNNNNNNPGNVSAPTAVTTLATNISGNSAQLNSLIFTSNVNTTAWFEWGPTALLGSRTNSASVGSMNSAVYSDSVFNLVPGVRYYYRAVAHNSGGTSYGSIMSVLTGGGAITNTTNTNNVVQRTVYVNNGVGVQSLVMLTIDGGSEFITPGEQRNYHVEWRNTSDQTLRDVVLRVMFPKSMTFDDATDGGFSTEDNTLVFNIKTLSPREEGEMFLSARANNPISEQELIVVTANMVYTNNSGVQNDALAYATHRVGKFGNTLGANVFWVGFFPDSFLGWLFLILLILLLILLAKYLQNEFSNKKYVMVAPLPPHRDDHNMNYQNPGYNNVGYNNPGYNNGNNNGGNNGGSH